MSTGEEAMQDLIDAVALGIAAREEETLLRSVSAGDDSIAAIVRENQAVIGRMALDVEQVSPPRRLRESIMTAVRESAPREPASAPSPEPVSVRRGGLLSRLGLATAGERFNMAAAGVAAALVLLLVGIALFSSRGGGIDAVEVPVAGTEAAPAVTGETLILENGSAVIRLSDLPPAASGRGYQLWRLSDGRVEPAGFLTLTGAGRAEALVTDLAGVDTIAVSIERLDNALAPTRTPIVTVELPDSTSGP